ncbi:hypothetical protein [Priestia aryabhattai]
MNLNLDYINQLQPDEYIKPYYKPIHSEFSNALEGEEWILDFNINSKEELLIAVHFFKLYLFFKQIRNKTLYQSFHLALKKTAENLESEHKILPTYSKEEFYKFSELMYQFFLSKFNVLFFFNTQKGS